MRISDWSSDVCSSDLLRETYSSQPAAPSEQLSPTAQVLVLAALLGHEINDANMTQLADRYRVAIMSISRAVDELEALKLAQRHHVGRQRRLRLRARKSVV